MHDGVPLMRCSLLFWGEVKKKKKSLQHFAHGWGVRQVKIWGLSGVAFLFLELN